MDASVRIDSNRQDGFWDSHRPLVSVVVACYAVRKYLPNFLASLDNQTVDPSRYEIIFVVDGCPENSGEVIQDWMPGTAYPVRIVTQANGGVASARNTGFHFATGNWLTSPDPDDVLDPEYLQGIESAFASFPGETMFVTRLQRTRLDGTLLPHPFDFKFAHTETRLVDLTHEPEFVHLSGGTTVWSRELLAQTGLRFDERLRTGSDADFNLHYLIDNGARYVVVPGSVYWYVNRGDGSSIIDRAAANYTRYELALGYSQPRILDHVDGPCPQWLANSLLYAMYHLFRGNLRPNSPVYQLHSTQRARIAEAVRSNLVRIGTDGIRAFRVVPLPVEIRHAWLAATAPLTTSPVLIRQQDPRRSRRRVSFYSSSSTVTVRDITQAGASRTWTRRVRSIEFLGEHWCFEHLFWVDIEPSSPVTVALESTALQLLHGGLAQHASVVRKREALVPPSAGEPPVQPVPWAVSLDTNSGATDQNRSSTSPLSTSTREPFPNGMWLIDHVGRDPRNAALLVEHLTATQPELPVWLLVDEDSALLSLPNTVSRASSHLVSALNNTAVVITSDPDWFAAHPPAGRPADRSWAQVLLPEQVSVWSQYRSIRAAHFDAVIAGTEFPFREMLSEQTPYEIESSDLWRIPLPHVEIVRAGWNEQPRQRVVVAPATRPSWQRFRDDIPLITEHAVTSGYVSQWNTVLASPELQQAAVQRGWEIQLIPPVEFPSLADVLEVPDWVVVLPCDARTRAMADAAVLISDYSALVADAHAAGIPTVLFQFDRENAEIEARLSLPGAFNFGQADLAYFVDSPEGIACALGQLPEHRLRPDFPAAASLRALDVIEASVRALASDAEGAVADVPKRFHTTYLVRAGADSTRLRNTLDSITQVLADDPTARLHILCPSSAHDTLSVAREFVSGDPKRVAVTSSSTDSLGDMLGSLDGRRLHVLSAGVLLDRSAPRHADTLLNQRSDLRCVAVPPTPGTLADIDGHAPSLRVVDLGTDPNAWISAEYSCLFLGETIPLERTATKFLELDFLQFVLLQTNSAGASLGVLFRGAACPSRPQTTRFVETHELMQARRATITSAIAAAPVAHPAARSLLLHQVLQLIAAAPSSGGPEQSPDDWPVLVARAVGMFNPAEIVESPWAKARSARYALCSAGGSLTPWHLDPTPGSQRILYRGIPVGRYPSLDVTITRLKVTNDHVSVETLFHRFSIAEADLVFRSESGQRISAVESQDLWEGVGRTYGRRRIAPAAYRRFELPLSQRETEWTLHVENTATGDIVPAVSVRQGPRSPFQEGREYLQHIRETGTVRAPRPGVLSISKNRLSSLRYAIASARRLRHEGLSAPERFRARRRKTIILITDRPKFGDDNGEALFRYIQRERPDLRRDTWFVLDKDAPSYPELRRTGRLVAPGSRKHRELYLNARILASSHMSEAYNNPFYGDKLAAYRDLTDFTFIWLQHGVTANAVGSVFNRVKRSIDGVVVATDHELRYALSPDFAHSKQTVLTTGFPRFDRLSDASGKGDPVLLYLPTWRAWLTGKRQSDGTSLPLDNFAQQEYYQHQKKFLTNPQLTTALERSGATIEMVLHPAMSAYADLYRGFASPRIIIHDPGSVRYSELFARGSALVTDYSSVFFDFAYLGKPVLFDHSDNEEFRAKHYGHGIFDYEASAPGPIATGIEDFLTQVIALIERGFTTDPSFNGRLDSIFLHRDQCNSARTVAAIEALDTERRSPTSPGVTGQSS